MAFNNRAFVGALNNALNAMSSTHNAIHSQRVLIDETLSTLQASSQALQNVQANFEDAMRALQTAIANFDDPTGGLQPINMARVQRTVDVYSGDETATTQSTTTGAGIFDSGLDLARDSRDAVAVLESSLILYTVSSPHLNNHTSILHGHHYLDQHTPFSSITAFISDNALDTRVAAAASTGSRMHRERIPCLLHIVNLIGTSLQRFSSETALSVEWAVDGYCFLLDIIPSRMLNRAIEDDQDRASDSEAGAVNGE